MEIQGFAPKIETSAQVASTDEPNDATEISLEDDLGRPSREIFSGAALSFDLSKRWTFTSEYYRLHRSGSANTTQEIVFDDVTYRAGGSIEGKFKTDIYRATLGYSLISRPNLELGVELGVHASNFSLAFSGEVQNSDMTRAIERRKRSVMAPLPTAGAFLRGRISDKLTAEASLDYFQLSLGDNTGQLVSAETRIAYRMAKRASVGVFYRFVDYEVRFERDLFAGKIEYKFDGPGIFLRYDL